MKRKRPKSHSKKAKVPRMKAGRYIVVPTWNPMLHVWSGYTQVFEPGIHMAKPAKRR